MTRRACLVLLCATISLGAARIAAAQPAADDFALTLTPYAWLNGVTGDVTTRGIDSSVDACFTEILDSSDSIVALAARAEGRSGRFGFYIDGVYNRIGVEDLAPRLGGADVIVEQYFIDFGLLYRVGQWPIGEPANAARWSLDATIGGRFVHMGVETDFEVGRTRKQNRDWIDPTIGLIARADMSEHLGFELRGDIGGFGAASDFTWSAFAVVAWRFDTGPTPASFFVGYKAIGHDYTDGNGFNEFAWDAVVHGPVLGLSFTF